jgi:hypothetical protein
MDQIDGRALVRIFELLAALITFRWARPRFVPVRDCARSTSARSRRNHLRTNSSLREYASMESTAAGAVVHSSEHHSCVLGHRQER